LQGHSGLVHGDRGLKVMVMRGRARDFDSRPAQAQVRDPKVFRGYLTSPRSGESVWPRASRRALGTRADHPRARAAGDSSSSNVVGCSRISVARCAGLRHCAGHPRARGLALGYTLSPAAAGLRHCAGHPRARGRAPWLRCFLSLRMLGGRGLWPGVVDSYALHLAKDDSQIMQDRPQ